MTGRYAENTQVPSDRSRAEIEATLRRYGASAFGYGWDEHAAAVSFRLGGRQIRFRLCLPDPNLNHHPTTFHLWEMTQ